MPAGAVVDDDGGLWISRWIDRTRTYVSSPALASVVTFSLVPSLVVLSFLAVRAEAHSLGFRISIALYVVVLLVAPYLIWYYDRRLFPEFCERFGSVLVTEDSVAGVGAKYRERYRRWWWIAALLAALPIPPLTWLGRGFFRARGLYGLGDPLFWLVELVLLWMGVLVGVGFLLVLVTLLVVRSVADLDLYIDPLHPDGLGGMSIVGTLAIRTTVLFSLGALLIPLQLQFATEVGAWATYLIYVMGCAYAVAIALSFVYPTVKINRRADELRSKILDDLREQYREIKREAAEPEIGATVGSTDTAVEQKLQRVRQEYQDYQQVRLYPMRVSILARLLGSVLLPLLFIVVDTMLRPEVLERVLSAIG